jgi:hypothetical protein
MLEPLTRENEDEVREAPVAKLTEDPPVAVRD